MSDRHPIQDAPQEKRDEVLRLVLAELQALQTMGAMNSLSAESFADLLLAKIERMADTRTPVSPEAYERMWHWVRRLPSDNIRYWIRVSDAVTHNTLACAEAGGRCAFRPENE